MKIGDKLYHPCSVDIIEHKIISIREYEDHKQYCLKSIHNVGACGKVEVLVIEDGNDRFKFITLLNDYEHQSGLQDFVEGNYYLTLNEAKAEYYSNIEKSLSSQLQRIEASYKNKQAELRRVKNLIKIARNI